MKTKLSALTLGVSFSLPKDGGVAMTTESAPARLRAVRQKLEPFSIQKPEPFSFQKVERLVSIGIDASLIVQGPKTAETRRARAFLAQQIAKYLKAAVSGYVLPHPRIRQRLIARLASVLGCSAHTIERLEREGVSEVRDFDAEGLGVTWDPALIDIFAGVYREAAADAAWRREQQKAWLGSTSQTPPTERDAP